MKYRMRQKGVEVLRLTVDLFNEDGMKTVRVFCAGATAIEKTSTESILIHTEAQIQEITVGEWIVKDGNIFYGCIDEIFKVDFEKV